MSIQYEYSIQVFLSFQNVCARILNNNVEKYTRNLPDENLLKVFQTINLYVQLPCINFCHIDAIQLNVGHEYST